MGERLRRFVGVDLGWLLGGGRAPFIIDGPLLVIAGAGAMAAVLGIAAGRP